MLNGVVENGRCVLYLFGVKVLFAILILFKELARPMAKQFVIGDLELEGSAVPCIVQGNIIRMDECQFLNLDDGLVWQTTKKVRLTRCLSSKYILPYNFIKRV